MVQVHFKNAATVYDVGTIYCIGRNYAEHARELNNPVPQSPIIFLKPAASLIFDGQSVVIPAASGDVHHEVEMVALIGKIGKRISLDMALGHVAGYGIGIDVTARDIQQRANESVMVLGNCSSWYRVGGTGGVFTHWPGTIEAFQREIAERALGGLEFGARKRAMSAAEES